jgi:DNA-binding LacI/PurR family transcriptional regulator
MKKRIRIEDVAKKAGISTATVSRYINQSAFVSPKNAERIRAVIEDLNYVPHAAAQILASKRTMTIGLVFPSLTSAFFSSLLRGIEIRASKDDFTLFIHLKSFPKRPGQGEYSVSTIRMALLSFPIRWMTRNSSEWLTLVFQLF